MNRTWGVAFSVFTAGLLLGVYVQHRWPIGRVLAPSAPAPEASTSDAVTEIRNTPPARRRIIVILGQSNAANYGSSRRHAGPGVHAYFDGRLFAAADPLPGGDGAGGSPWTRLGARLLASGDVDRVVLAVVAQGSTSAADFAPGGRLHERLRRTLIDLGKLDLPADHILWQQGETEGSNAEVGGSDYAATVVRVIESCREIAPHARVVVAQATRTAAPITNEQIRAAQERLSRAHGVQRGPDLDALGADYRQDGVHFNDRGLDAVAEAWLQCLRTDSARIPKT